MRMQDNLDRCERLEVDIKGLEYFLLAPNELSVDIRHIALHARGDRHQKRVHTSSRQGGHALWVASAARWDEHQRMLTENEQKCQELNETIEQLGKRP